ncbi:MAG TPA: VIT domain-containing protein [Actinocatenispora sp.]
MTVQVTPLPDEELDRVGARRAGAPATDDEAGAGALSTAKGNLPLDTIDVRATITGLTARTVLRQGFRNPHAEPLEATYVFPLPPRAAVTALRMEAADRVVEGELKERGQARQEYDEAIASGRRASIAEEERPDVFTMRVGNILPGERVTVELTLDGPLPYADDAATYRFPLVVAPRYVPGAPLAGESVGSGVVPDTDAVPDASRITPPVLLPGFPNPVALSIAVDVDPAGLPLTGIRSSLHTVTRDEAGTHLAVAPGERADRDFVLRLGYGAAAEATALTVVPDGAGDDRFGTGTFRLTVLPPAGTVRPRPRDVVLLLDRSGSMAGWKMVAARRAAARIVDTLTDDDRFAVLLFDNVVERPPGLDEGLAKATDRLRFRAVEELARTDARGGTELLRPLTEGLGLLADESRDRVLVLVTDGQVGNEDQILARTGDALRAVRVHTVGIDQAVNAGFLGRLATLGGGRCELVESEDRLDEAMDRIHRRIASPVVTGLRLTTDGLDVVDGTVAPARLPDLFPGAPVVVSGRTRSAGGGATLVGTRPDGAEWRVTLDATTADAPAAAAVWARGHLRDLEDECASGHGDRDELERTIVATSLRFGVLCRFTAYVAVDSRVVTEGGIPHRVTQPVELPAGWQPMAPPPAPGGTGAMTMMASHARMAPAAPGAPAPAPYGGPAPAPRAGRGPGVAAGPRGFAPTHRRRDPVDPMRAARTQVADELRALRSAGGALNRSTVLADLGTRLAVLVDTLPADAPDRDGLAELVTALRECDGPRPPAGDDLDRLWQRTLDVLAAFTDGAGTTEGQQARAARRGAFWKRR